MTDIETVVRDTLQEHVLPPVDLADLTDLAASARREASARRRAGRRRVVFAVGVVASAATLGALLIRPWAGGGGLAGFNGRLPATAPAGWQVVSSLGVELNAPAGWAVAVREPCDATATVVRGGGVRPTSLCVPLQPDTVTFVRIAQSSAVSLSRPGGGVPATVSSPRTLRVGDTPAELREGRLADGRSYYGLTFSSVGVTVEAVGAEAEVLRQIMRTARPVSVDDAGCATGQPGAPRAAAGQVSAPVRPGQPVSVGVCYYEERRLSASTTLAGSAATDVAASIAAAAPGRLTNGSACPPSLPRRAAPQMWLQLTYADGTKATLQVRWEGGCDGPQFVASATGVSHVTMRMLRATLGPLGIGYGVPSNVLHG